jgi:magnesium/cobalt transport protein CorA
MATEAKSPGRSRGPGRPGRRNGATTTGRVTGAASERPTAKRSTGPRIEGRLFDGSGRDHDVEVTPALVKRLGAKQTLWVDVEQPDETIVGRLADLFGLRVDSVRALRERRGQPHVAVFDDYLQLSVVPVQVDTDGGHEEAVDLTLIAGSNFVITFHREPVAFLEAFREHLRGDTSIGLVDGAAFLAALLDWHLTGYFQVVDALELEADELDNRALHPRSEKDLLADLVRLRRRISSIRRRLAPHREVFAALTRPDLAGLGDAEDTVHFRSLADRLERAIDAVDSARELVLGSFDVHMTRTAQRTNDVMKILTLVTVILLPGSVIAGVMGMNFKVGFFEDPSVFWLVLGGMGVIALATLLVARVKRWI